MSLSLTGVEISSKNLLPSISNLILIHILRLNDDLCDSLTAAVVAFLLPAPSFPFSGLRVERHLRRQDCRIEQLSATKATKLDCFQHRIESSIFGGESLFAGRQDPESSQLPSLELEAPPP